jgi:hypothetical protein
VDRKSATAKIKVVLSLGLLRLRLSRLVETSAAQKRLTPKIEVDVRVLVHAERVGRQVRGRIEVGVRDLARLLGVGTIGLRSQRTVRIEKIVGIEIVEIQKIVGIEIVEIEKIVRMGVVGVAADAAMRRVAPPRGGKSRQRTRA